MLLSPGSLGPALGGCFVSLVPVAAAASCSQVDGGASRLQMQAFPQVSVTGTEVSRSSQLHDHRARFQCRFFTSSLNEMD